MNIDISDPEFKPRIDHELQEFLRPLDKDELAMLTENCKSDPDHVVMPPIQVCPEMAGAIIDGHHQYGIRKELNLKTRYAEKSIVGGVPNAVEYMLKLQLGRRNLTPSQRAYFITKAAQRYSNGGDRKSENRATAGGKTAEELAKLAGVSEKTIRFSAKVCDHGTAPVLDGVKDGTFTASDAANIVSLPISLQEQIVEQAKLNGATLAKTKISGGKSFDVAEIEAAPDRKAPTNGQSVVDGKECHIALETLSKLVRSMKKLDLYDKHHRQLSEMLRDVRELGSLTPLPIRGSFNAHW